MICFLVTTFFYQEIKIIYLEIDSDPVYFILIGLCLTKRFLNTTFGNLNKKYDKVLVYWFLFIGFMDVKLRVGKLLEENIRKKPK